MSKKKTSKRKKRTSKRKTGKRGLNIGGLKIGNSTFGANKESIENMKKAAVKGVTGNPLGAMSAAFKASKGIDVNINEGDLKSAANSLSNAANHPLTGQLVNGLLNQQHIPRQHIPRYESPQYQPEYHRQQNWPQQSEQPYYPPAQYPNEGQLPVAVPSSPEIGQVINKDNIDTALHGAKGALDLVNSDKNFSKVADAAGNVADAASVAVRVAATPLLIQQVGTDAAVEAGKFGTKAALQSGQLGLDVGLNAGKTIGNTAVEGSNKIAQQSFGLASKILDVPDALFNAAKWAASDPASLNFIKINGVGGRTKFAIKQKLMTILNLKIAGMEAKKKGYIDTIQNVINTYRMRVRCRKDSSDLYYSNRFIVPAVFSYCDYEINEVIGDVENIESEIVVKLDEQITSVKDKFQTILTKSLQIMDIDSYKKFYYEQLEPELVIFNDFANKESENMNLTYTSFYSKLLKKLGRETGGKRKNNKTKKSKKTRTVKKRKTLRKKRT